MVRWGHICQYSPFNCILFVSIVFWYFSSFVLLYLVVCWFHFGLSINWSVKFVVCCLYFKFEDRFFPILVSWIVILLRDVVFVGIATRNRCCSTYKWSFRFFVDCLLMWTLKWTCMQTSIDVNLAMNMHASFFILQSHVKWLCLKYNMWWDPSWKHTYWFLEFVLLV